MVVPWPCLARTNPFSSKALTDSRTTDRLTSNDWHSAGSGGIRLLEGYSPETIRSTRILTTTTLRRAGRLAREAVVHFG